MHSAQALHGSCVPWLGIEVVQAIPYDFDAYQAATEQLYRVLWESADVVQAVSVDEAYVCVHFGADCADEVRARWSRLLCARVHGRAENARADSGF